MKEKTLDINSSETNRGCNIIKCLKMSWYSVRYKKIESVLPFFEEQLCVIGNEPIYAKSYKKALGNIELLVEAANEVVY